MFSIKKNQFLNKEKYLINFKDIEDLLPVNIESINNNKNNIPFLSLHGFFRDDSCFKLLNNYLINKGLCFLNVNNFRSESLSAKNSMMIQTKSLIKGMLDLYSQDINISKTKLVINGHSQGGLIGILTGLVLSRKYDIKVLVNCISTPFHGTRAASRLYFGPATKDLGPGSEFINTIKKGVSIKNNKLQINVINTKLPEKFRRKIYDKYKFFNCISKFVDIDLQKDHDAILSLKTQNPDYISNKIKIDEVVIESLHEKLNNLRPFLGNRLKNLIDEKEVPPVLENPKTFDLIYSNIKNI